jgi:hypothetical protein
MHAEVRLSPRQKAGPVLRYFPVLGWLWLLGMLPFCVDAGYDDFLMAVYLTSGSLIGIFWCFLFFRAIGQLPVCREWVGWLWWVWWWTVPLAGFLGVYAKGSDQGLIARVALSESALNAYVANIPPAFSDETPRRVGLFWVQGTQERSGAVLLYTSRGGNRYGLAYVPSGKGPHPLIRVRHLYGPWYAFEIRS